MLLNAVKDKTRYKLKKAALWAQTTVIFSHFIVACGFTLLQIKRAKKVDKLTLKLYFPSPSILIFSRPYLRNPCRSVLLKLTVNFDTYTMNQLRQLAV